jgi:hypothetical protein
VKNISQRYLSRNLSVLKKRTMHADNAVNEDKIATIKCGGQPIFMDAANNGPLRATA